MNKVGLFVGLFLLHLCFDLTCLCRRPAYAELLLIQLSRTVKIIFTLKQTTCWFLAFLFIYFTDVNFIIFSTFIILLIINSDLVSSPSLCSHQVSFSWLIIICLMPLIIMLFHRQCFHFRSRFHCLPHFGCIMQTNFSSRANKEPMTLAEKETLQSRGRAWSFTHSFKT